MNQKCYHSNYSLINNRWILALFWQIRQKWPLLQYFATCLYCCVKSKWQNTNLLPSMGRTMYAYHIRIIPKSETCSSSKKIACDVSWQDVCYILTRIALKSIYLHINSHIASIYTWHKKNLSMFLDQYSV